MLGMCERKERDRTPGREGRDKKKETKEEYEKRTTIEEAKLEQAKRRAWRRASTIDDARIIARSHV